VVGGSSALTPYPTFPRGLTHCSCGGYDRELHLFMEIGGTRNDFPSSTMSSESSGKARDGGRSEMEQGE
jgi:hypothetical protein